MIPSVWLTTHSNCLRKSEIGTNKIVHKLSDMTRQPNNCVVWPFSQKDASNITIATISISFTFIEIIRPRCDLDMSAILRALFITLIDCVRLVSTIINHEHIVWSTSGTTLEDGL